MDKKEQMKLVLMVLSMTSIIQYSYGKFTPQSFSSFNKKDENHPNPTSNKESDGGELMNVEYSQKDLVPKKAIITPVYKYNGGNETIGKDNGFGNTYVWAGSLESGIQIATNHNKPVMVIIHKSWCKACKNLKPKFANSSEIQTLSKHFVMVNLIDDEEPPSNNFAPDGTYIPRILFVSPNGLVDQDIFNEEGSSQHKFFYSRPEQIAKSMRKVLEKYNMEQFDV